MLRPLRNFVACHLSFAILLSLIFAISVSAQIQTGTPPFGSFSGSPDAINLANLNAHWTIPVLHKPGRGTDFQYDLTYDSSVWYPGTTGSTKYWVPVSDWGWSSYNNIGSGLTGYVTYYYSSTYCYDSMGHPNGADTYYGNYVYYDPWGTRHAFNGVYEVKTGGCGSSTTNTFPSTASDGSGYTIQSISGPLNTKDGMAVAAPFGFYPPGGSFASSTTDRNGNTINVTSAGVFTDTLGTTALTISGSSDVLPLIRAEAYMISHLRRRGYDQEEVQRSGDHCRAEAVGGGTQGGGCGPGDGCE